MRGKSSFFVFPQESTETDGQIEGLWSDETLIIFLCFDRGKYVVKCVTTLFSREKDDSEEKTMPKNGHIFDNVGYNGSFC